MDIKISDLLKESTYVHYGFTLIEHELNQYGLKLIELDCVPKPEHRTFRLVPIDLYYCYWIKSDFEFKDLTLDSIVSI